MTIALGSRLGSYEILSPLGAGGMGEVYRARDPRLAREVAIKVLPAEFSSDPSRLKRFEKEARAASALNHPNIVTIYEIGSQGETSFIAMERVEGKTLREILFSGPLPTKRLLAIAAQIADGLAKAHEAGIVHRDLKPENVMVTKDGLVKILDFGLAKQTRAGSGSDEGSHLPTETGTSPGMILGTVGYMSPEQAAGQPIDFRSDQFAFGSILYEMATGKRAFQKKTAVDTLSAILNEEPKPIAEISPQAPAPLRWIVDRCLTKDADGRYASTKDLARELATVRDRLGEASVSGTTRAASRSKSVQVRTVLLALVLLAAVVGGFFAGRPVWKARFAYQPKIRQLTFRRGGIFRARFAPDGQIIYSGTAIAITKGNPGELFATRPGTPEPRALGLPPANVLSISSSGELAILVGGWPALGTLATVSLAGGAPRELLNDVREATWSPNGKSVAATHIVSGKMRLEFPIGRVLYEPPGWIAHPEFSPRGDSIAFIDVGTWLPGATSRQLTLIDLQGRRTKIAAIPSEFKWSPQGDELWYNQIEEGTTSLRALTLSGHTRLLASFPGDFVLQDVARDGRILLERATEQREIIGRFPGDAEERNLSWLDGSIPVDLSADGETLLFAENGQGGGAHGAVYKRGTRGSPAVRLGEGFPLALSRDGLWALTSPSAEASDLVLLPTGPGQARKISLSGIRVVGRGSAFFPDGKRILLRGAEPGHKPRLYVLDIDGARKRAITPEGISTESQIAVSPDGKSVIASDGDGTELYDVEGGPARTVPGLSPGLYAVRWCADGRSLFVRTGGIRPLKVYRFDLSSRRLDPWKEISVSDIGAGAIGVIPTPDGRSYVYGYTRYFSDLFIADGLK